MYKSEKQVVIVTPKPLENQDKPLFQKDLFGP
jgi:hypothetical protein